MMFSQRIYNEKTKLRGELLKKAAALCLENGNIAKKVLARREWQEAKTVFCYVSYKYEPDTMPVLAAALSCGKTLCVPLCEKDGVMRAIKINCLSELKKGFYGILEPPATAEEVKPEQIDLAVIPCLAADKRLNRLGKGGGYYDRFLPKCKPDCVKLLLCRKELVCEFPVDGHDVKADILITD